LFAGTATSSDSDDDGSLFRPPESLGYDTETEKQKARERLNKNRTDLPNRFGKEVLTPKLKNKPG